MYLGLIRSFFRASLQQDMAYRSNFWISLLHSLLNLATGWLGLSVLFGQIDTLQGWDYPSALAILGVYLSVSALRGLFIGPSLEALAGLGQEIWSGSFDFTLLRPVDTQFLVTFRQWRVFAGLDLLLGLGVLVQAVILSGEPLRLLNLLGFLAALTAALLSLYAVLLAFTALVFWSPGFLFTWVFDALFQMARYPVGIYPAGLRWLLTWIIPVGVITTIPAQALLGTAPAPLLLASLAFAIILVTAASIFFRSAMRRYTSASS